MKIEALPPDMRAHYAGTIGDIAEVRVSLDARTILVVKNNGQGDTWVSRHDSDPHKMVATGNF